MASVRATSRMMIVAGLVAGLGFAGICPCSAGSARGGMPHRASRTSHICPCVLATGHCCCGAACQCGKQAPQKDNEPAVPSPSNDRSQPLGLVANAATLTGITLAACHADCCPAMLTGGNLSLVAQGTRLNC